MYTLSLPHKWIPKRRLKTLLVESWNAGEIQEYEGPTTYLRSKPMLCKGQQ